MDCIEILFAVRKVGDVDADPDADADPEAAVDAAESPNVGVASGA